MTPRTRLAALALTGALVLTGCDEAPTGDCGPGRQRGPDGVSCDTIPATQRAAQSREDTP